MHRIARRSIRLPGYDYRLAGWYFVTVCTHGRKPLLGAVIDGRMILNASGRIVNSGIRNIKRPGGRVSVDSFMVMPNHFHLIIMISGADNDSDVRYMPPLQRPHRAGAAFGAVPRSMTACVMSLKSVTARRINRLRRTPGDRVWQRNYWERVIRDEAERDIIRQYIKENPERWWARRS